MTNRVLIKRSGTANSVPLAGDLQAGELAINYTDGNLFFKNSSNVVTTIASNKFVSVSGNVTGGNVLTVGQISATGTITSAGGTNGTGFAVGNSAVSNVALGFFPTAGTKADMAIRDYSTVSSTMYFDVGMGGTAAGEFQFRTTNSFSTIMTANTTGLTVTGSVYGAELWSTNSVGSEGGQINLAVPASGSTISGGVIIDVYNNQLRFFERTGTNRGAYIDLTAAAAGVGSNLLAGGSSSTPTQIVNGTSNVSVTSSGNITANVAGAWAASFYSAGMIANSFWSNTNGTGQNFKVGDDAWIGDVNNADTVGIQGQQNAANAYIVFGNADNSSRLGRAGSGPLTYAGAFSAAGNITGGNVDTAGLITATGNIIGNRIAVAAGTAAAPSVQFSNDIAADTGFYWISDGNIGVTTNGTLRATFLDTGLSVVGNITGGNLNAAGLSLSSNVVSALNVTGNIAGGNILTPGIISATGNVSGGNVAAVTNIFSFGTIQGTGNVSGGNLTTAGQVSGTGNITGGNITTSGLITATGNVSGGNLIQGGVRVAKFTTSETTPTNAVPGDQWFIASTGKRYEYINDGTSNVWVDQSQSTSFESLAVSGNATIGGTITGNLNATSNIYVNGTVFTRTLTVGTIGSSPVTIPISSNNSIEVLTIASGNVAVYTT